MFKQPGTGPSKCILKQSVDTFGSRLLILAGNKGTSARRRYSARLPQEPEGKRWMVVMETASCYTTVSHEDAPSAEHGFSNLGLSWRWG